MAKVKRADANVGVRDAGDPLATLFAAVVRQAIADVQKGRNCAEEARQFLDHICPNWAGWVDNGNRVRQIGT